MGLILASGRIEDLDSPDNHIEFVRSQWRDFAAFAWQKYLSEGRGALVIDLRRAAKSAESLHVPIHYVADLSERLDKLGGWPSEEIAEVVREYDPEQDVVLVFLRLDGEVLHYNVSDELTPPSASAYKAEREREPHDAAPK
jgi:hypothetical protein